MKIYKTGNGNDMRSRSIEGKNPLYLPQANTFDGCAVHSRCIYVTDQPLLIDTMISIEIKRDNERAFEGSVGIAQMKRTVEELVSFVYRECNFSNGRLKMTGTGVVQPNDFALQSAMKSLLR